jgi:hypothetical protein
MYDRLLGGKDNFAADREAAEANLRVLPEGRAMGLANSAFLGRVVRHLAAARRRNMKDIPDPVGKRARDVQVTGPDGHHGRHYPRSVKSATRRIRRGSSTPSRTRPCRGARLALSHGTDDFDTERARAGVRGYDKATAPFVLRDHKTVSGFFTGLDVVEPGVVQLPWWRPDGEVPEDSGKIWLCGGVGIKV